MPRNEQSVRAVTAWLNHLLTQPDEQQKLVAAAREAHPSKAPARGALLTKQQRQWLYRDLPLFAESWHVFNHDALKKNEV